MNAADASSCPLSFGGARIEFPQSFELRIIYAIARAGNLREELAAIFAGQSVPCTAMRDVATKPGKYARLAATVLFGNLVQMRAVYDAVGKLPGVRGLF